MDAIAPPGQLFTVATLDREPGLLFSEDVSFERVLEFLRAPQSLIRLPAFVTRLGDEHFVAQTVPHIIQADKANEHQVFWKVTADCVEEYSPYKRFNRCSLLIKVMGCEHCEHNTTDCHQTGGAFPELTKRPRLVAMDPENVIKAGQAKGGLVIAEVTYVPPAWTRTGTFEDQIRPVHQHDFSLIEGNLKKWQERAAEGAATRRAYRDNCSRCLFGQKSKAGNARPGCDARVKYCGGPFDSEEAQQKYLLEKWDPKVETFLKTDEFTRGQFWAIARGAGMETKSGKYNVALSGWVHSERNGFEVKAVRARTWITNYPFRNCNYGEVRDVFEALPGLTSEIKAPPPQVRAVWYLSLEATSIHCSQGWGNGYRDIVWRKVLHDSVEIKTAAPRYFAWGVRTLRTFYEAFLYFRKKPEITLPRDQT